MRMARLGTGIFLLGLVAGGVMLHGCRKSGSELSGSTYCDATAGSTQVPMSSLPSGSCKGSSTCIAFTAGDPCTSQPSVAAPDCQWTCTCVDDTWSCSESCDHTDCPDDGGTVPVVDSSTTD